MSQRILDEILAEVIAGRPAVLVSVVEFRGSVPRKDYPRCLFFADGRQRGTVGGGCVDVYARQLAGRVLDQGGVLRSEHELDSVDAEESGLVCGGRMTLEARRYDPGEDSIAKLRVMRDDPELRPPRLLVFGGGHVGLAAAQVAHVAGFAITVLDDREAYANEERFPFADHCLAGPVSRADSLTDWGEKDAILVATRGHRQDLEAMDWAVRTRAGFIGLLGSARKREVIAQMLGQRGIDLAKLEKRWHSPVGLEIGAVTPEEIAVAAVAQLIAFRREAL